MRNRHRSNCSLKNYFFIIYLSSLSHNIVRFCACLLKFSFQQCSFCFHLFLSSYCEIFSREISWYINTINCLNQTSLSTYNVAIQNVLKRRASLWYICFYPWIETISVLQGVITMQILRFILRVRLHEAKPRGSGIQHVIRCHKSSLLSWLSVLSTQFQYHY